MSRRAVSLPDLAGALAMILLAGLAAYALSRGDEPPLSRSAMGMKGLEQVLQARGMDIAHARFEQIETGTLGLRILPILDTDPNVDFIRPQADADYLETGTERDLPLHVLQTKIDRQRTLLIAPKWTRAVRLSGYAHASLLLPEPEARAALAALGLVSEPLLRPGGPVLRFEHAGYQGVLYQPQLFSPVPPAGCEPLVSLPLGHLMLRCSRGGDRPPVFLLSDPDLMNTHGLARGRNAALAQALIERIATDGPIRIDTSDHIFSFEAETPLPARDWADLLRFVRYPYAIAWVGLAALTALLLWRAGVRFGPARQIFDDRLGAARRTSIAAKAQILRVAGNDRRLFSAHIANRLRHIERALFGTNAPGDPVPRIVALVERNDPDLASGFANTAGAATTPGPELSATQLTALLEKFERQADRLFDGSR